MTISVATPLSSNRSRAGPTLEQVYAWENLLLAWRKAARGKRGTPGVAAFEHQVADRLLDLQRRLTEGTWKPGGYVHFTITEPKRRVISAAPFADRVVHHALCNVIEPVFETLFIPDSYANRFGKGTHRAVDRVQALSQRFRYVLSLDIVKHFPSIDHAILLETLGKHLRDPRLLALAARIIASGDGIADQEYRMVWFPGDDLLSACRPRGLPIGNLTSQFWSNCFLHPLDQFITRGLGCGGYVRYVDDMVLFADSRAHLWDWKRAVVERVAGMRLTVHTGSAQVRPVGAGIPWLGFVVFPTHRRVKGRKVVETTRRLGSAFDDWRTGRISFARFDAGVQGWINHVRYADSWGLRTHVLKPFVW
jgi:retron-type reverse transcriptase